MRPVNAVLGDFRPLDAMRTTPSPHATVTGMGQRVASFLVAPEPRKAVSGT